MKKINLFFVAIAIALTFSFTACGSSDDETDDGLSVHKSKILGCWEVDNENITYYYEFTQDGICYIWQTENGEQKDYAKTKYSLIYDNVGTYLLQMSGSKVSDSFEYQFENNTFVFLRTEGGGTLTKTTKPDYLEYNDVEKPVKDLNVLTFNGHSGVKVTTYLENKGFGLNDGTNRKLTITPQDKSLKPMVFYLRHFENWFNLEHCIGKDIFKTGYQVGVVSILYDNKDFFWEESISTKVVSAKDGISILELNIISKDKSIDVKGYIEVVYK
ncbi:hypothetical protein IR083_21290 [Dysgonomonas sp. GY75]|uniref:hypothetical protein n=1 Tax=Dysgonomonas sp. GY75 TaxID=2780419 RepID=UPI0018838892|nr:hypothetical protein [Dysgonomonas sp. GY75]MBF0651354.1 hypothetical protein [Dysgonomonas sp. GY75]